MNKILNTILITIVSFLILIDLSAIVTSVPPTPHIIRGAVFNSDGTYYTQSPLTVTINNTFLWKHFIKISQINQNITLT